MMKKGPQPAAQPRDENACLAYENSNVKDLAFKKKFLGSLGMHHFVLKPFFNRQSQT
jgi:hypothetical protein